MRRSSKRNRIVVSVAVCVAACLVGRPVDAAITVTHQYNVGDGLDAGTNGGSASGLADNVGAVNLSQSGTSAVYTNSVSSDAAAKVGSTLAVNVDAPTGFYSAGNALLGGASANYGFDLWIKPDAASQSANIFFPEGWEFGTGGGKGGLGVAQSGTAVQLIAPNVSNLGTLMTANTGQWTHVGVTLSGTNVVRGYVNGELVLMSTSVNPSEAGGGAHLAVNSGGAAGWDGQFDHVRVFTFASGQFDQGDFSNEVANLGLGGAATQSSTLSNPANPNASKAIDNNINGTFSAGSVTHTNTENNPWWEVNMPQYGGIDRVVLNNRTDCCGDRLSNLVLTAYNNDGDLLWTSPTINPGNVLGSPTKIVVDVPDFIQADRLRVTRQQASAVLSIAEVQILGYRLENLSLNKPASQSSTLGGSYVASKAVNGNYNNVNPEFSHTADTDTAPWWQVDLGDGVAKNFGIETIYLHNREDCCGGRFRDLTIQIFDAANVLVFDSFVEMGILLNADNVLGGGISDFAAGPAFIELDLLELLGYRVEGRYVRVLRTPSTAGGNNGDNRVLTLGEVEVLGVEIPAPAALPAGFALLSLAAMCRRSPRR